MLLDFKVSLSRKFYTQIPKKKKKRTVIYDKISVSSGEMGANPGMSDKL
jgi:hypothetical protein